MCPAHTLFVSTNVRASGSRFTAVAGCARNKTTPDCLSGTRRCTAIYQKSLSSVSTMRASDSARSNRMGSFHLAQSVRAHRTSWPPTRRASTIASESSRRRAGASRLNAVSGSNVGPSSWQHAGTGFPWEDFGVVWVRFQGSLRQPTRLGPLPSPSRLAGTCPANGSIPLSESPTTCSESATPDRRVGRDTAKWRMSSFR